MIQLVRSCGTGPRSVRPLFSSLIALFLLLPVPLQATAGPAAGAPGTGEGAAVAVVWSVQNGNILRNGQVVPIFGINWFGMETRDHAPHGLWTGRSVDSFLDQVVGFGFTALRLPVSPETINPGFRVSSWAKKYAADGRGMLEYMLAAAQRKGLHVLLDFHTFKPGSLPGAPYGRGYPVDYWIRDMRTLAQLSNTYPNVMGIDLCNEPHALTWTEWSSLAAQAAQAIGAINPNTLIFVEGVGGASPSGTYGTNWGGNLYEAGAIPGIPADRLVYSPHAYGHSVYVQPYFNDPTFPANMPAIWESHFGHLAGKGFTLAPGEFGGRYEGDDAIWQDAFVDYLITKAVGGFFYWCLNPNSGDTGGILQTDWLTPVQPKIALLQRLMNGTAGKRLAAGEAPSAFTLDGAYPNPFNPATTIRFGLPEASHVTLGVYDVLGREVARLVDGPLGPGYHDAPFDAGERSTGVYLYRLTARGESGSRFVRTGLATLLR
jgi:endoglucanase